MQPFARSTEILLAALGTRAIHQTTWGEASSASSIISVQCGQMVGG